MTDTTEGLQTTALHPLHLNAGAAMTEFGGWHMPLRYTSQLAEHTAVRTSAGLFDLSHMGEVWVTGPQAAEALDRALVSKIGAVKVGKAKYSMICTPEGGIIDDLITYRLAEDVFLVVPNAGNAPTVAAELTARAEGFDATVTDVSAHTSMLALQGPKAEEILLRVVDEADAQVVTGMKYYSAAPLAVAGIEVLLARTGYTGEDGFELMLLPGEPGQDGELRTQDAQDLWAALAKACEGDELVPCGLACRDTLRLEAGMPLYGHELTRDIDPYVAGLGVLVRLDKEDEQAPVGREAFAAAKQQHEAAAPGRRVLVGLQGEGRRAAREGCALYAGQEQVGVVTSGVLSPTLGHPIALAHVDIAHSEQGTALEADVRGTRLPMTVVPTPFYSRNR